MDIERLSVNETIDRKRVQLSEFSGVYVGLFQNRLVQIGVGSGVVVIVGEDVDLRPAGGDPQGREQQAARQTECRKTRDGEEEKIAVSSGCEFLSHFSVGCEERSTRWKSGTR